MTQDELSQLDVGDIVRHKNSMDRYMVTSNYGSRVTLVRALDPTNADKWNIVSKVKRRAFGEEISKG